MHRFFHKNSFKFSSSKIREILRCKKSEHNSLFAGPKVYTIIFIVLIFASLLVRVLNYHYPTISTESNRDYLIAHHIVEYGEYIYLGGDIGIIGELKQSPLFYYVLSIPLLIYDSVSTLGLFNILMQLGVLVVIYILTRGMFGPVTALIAVVLFSFGREILYQSRYVWRPYSMQPFVNFGYLFLFLAYTHKKFMYILVALVALSIAVAMHLSAAFIAPMFLVLVIYILYTQDTKIKNYLSALLVFAGSLGLFYITSIIHAFSLGHDKESLVFNADFYIKSLPELFNNITGSFESLVFTFFSKGSLHHVSVFVMIVLIIGVVIYFLFEKNKRKKAYLLVISAFIIQQVVLVGIISYSINSYYLTAIYSLFIIFISQVLYFLFFRNRYVLPIGILAVAIMIGIFYSGHYFSNKSWNYFTDVEVVESVTSAIKNEILSIKNADGKDDIDFFQLRLLERAHDGTTVEKPYGIDAVFWNTLEKEFNRRFTHVSHNYYYFNYAPINSDEYIFLVCQKYFRNDETDLSSECLDVYFKQSPDYYFIKEINHSEPFIIYLTRKKNEAN